MSTSTEGRRHKIIMAVDDAAEILSFLKRLIEAQGYSYIGLGSGKECLNLVSKLIPRVLLLDLQMPEMNGFETCRRLRFQTGFKQVPIVFLTASKTSEAVRSGIQAGGNDFLVKPCDPQILCERLEHWSNRRISQASWR